MKHDREVWTLKYKDGHFVFAPGCWLAPLTYRNREQARKSAHEFKRHGMKVKPVKIRLQVRATEVKNAGV